MSQLTENGLMRAYAYLLAYCKGTFPMAHSRESPGVILIDPEFRGIIPLTRFHVPRRFRRTLRKDPFQIRFNCDFRSVIEGCADREQTWINDEIIGSFLTLNRIGFAHSVEAWDGDRLAGGLYGVAIRGAFFGESMFTNKPEASKVALVHLADRLISCNFGLLDTQFLNDHLSTFGATEISRREFKALLAEALERDTEFNGSYPASPGSEVLQRISQTS
ncbi:MAG: leucyl/phenylalanyl-tRNA--protein transferase [Albidovulum sp.]|nr:leucyl/phenylalanyl-tRNA--protein transferase [Albidovulum sp.]